MGAVICKPCIALDALAAISLREAGPDGFREDIPRVKDWVEENLLGIKIPGSNSYFDLLAASYSFDEIERMDLRAFCEKYLPCIKGSAFEKEFIVGLRILREADFTRLWERYCLPFLTGQCAEYDAALQSEEKMVFGVLSDMQYIKPNWRIDDIYIYITYFSQNVSFQLASNRYLTNNAGDRAINIKNILGLFAHELTHGAFNAHG